MFAYLLEDLRDWRELRLRRSAAECSAAMAIAGAVSLLQPLVLALMASVLFILQGWADGNRYKPGLEQRRLLLGIRIRPRSMVAAKLLSILAAWLFVAVILAPPCALACLVWGVKGGAVALCVLSWLVAYTASACVGFVSSLLFDRTEGLPGLALLALWLCLPLFAPQVSAASPFVQVWDALKEEGALAPLIGIAATACATALLLAGAAWALSHARRREHG